MSITITRVRCVRTRADGSWVLVAVETSEPGLIGWGSASDPFNPAAVTAVVEQSYAPQLIGRDVDDITDIWQTLYASGYWRNGSITNTALAGIDVALWDILGQRARLPIHQLLGGRARTTIPCYAHASGTTVAELLTDVARYVDAGWPAVRAQLGAYGGGGFVPARTRSPAEPDDAGSPSMAFDEDVYIGAVVEALSAVRERFGAGLKLTHDVHSHLTPRAALRLAERLQPLDLFFLEDLLPPEQLAWYDTVRRSSSTPMAVGELFTHPAEWRPLIANRQIDFIRTRVSKIGGITPAVKLAALAEAFGVRTAWQEGADNDPLNFAAAIHLDTAVWNFGIQEENGFTAGERAAFPGTPEVVNGHVAPPVAPGLGVQVDEAAAADLWNGDPATYHRHHRLDRAPDGTMIRP